MLEDEPLPISSDWTWPIILFAFVAIVIVVGASIALRHTDPIVAGTFVPGDNCTVLTCPAGPAGPPGPSIAGPPGPRGELGPTGKRALCGVFLRD